ncbi:MAG: glycosyltransferase family 2 protein [Planctomycetes bacterium]|nr:glycosyltransferase family 2 protein [Planctomycetota bacterium]
MVNDPTQTTRSSKRYSISVFFPCFNEQATVESLTRKSVSVLEKLTDDFEVIIVNDGSRDDTAGIADRLAGEIPQVRVVHHPVNLGYGLALQSGFRAATKELVFYTDGDSQFNIAELADILPLIDRHDIVSCYRLNRQEGLIRKFNAFCWTRLVCLLFGLRLRDIDCAFKLYRRGVFEGMHLVSTGALIDTEVLARAARKGCTIVQKGVHHYPRVAGRPTGASLRVIMRAFRELFHLYKLIHRES